VLAETSKIKASRKPGRHQPPLVQQPGQNSAGPRAGGWQRSTWVAVPGLQEQQAQIHGRNLPGALPAMRSKAGDSRGTRRATEASLSRPSRQPCGSKPSAARASGYQPPWEV